MRSIVIAAFVLVTIPLVTASNALGADEESLDKELGKDQIRIKLGYPGPEAFKGKDPRPAESIYAALKASAKLK